MRVTMYCRASISYSDGVFAIAVTLLVLDVKVPRGLDAGRTHVLALGAMWPTYPAFITKKRCCAFRPTRVRFDAAASFGYATVDRARAMRCRSS